MAFSDPITVSVGGSSQTLARVGQGINSGSFSKDDGSFKASISHSYGKRTRRAFRFQYTKVAADPLISAQNIVYTMAVTVVVDQPITGFTISEASSIVKAVTDYLNASSGAATTKLLGGES